MKERCLVFLCQSLIKSAQENIGLVPYKILRDENGMVSAGDLMKQPFEYKIFHANNYDYSLGKEVGNHIVINKSTFKVLYPCSSSRDGNMDKTFNSAIELARHCASAQIKIATKISLSNDKEFQKLNPKKSYEEFERHTFRIMDEEKLLSERLDLHLRTKKVRLKNWLVNWLS